MVLLHYTKARKALCERGVCVRGWKVRRYGSRVCLRAKASKKPAKVLLITSNICSSNDSSGIHCTTGHSLESFMRDVAKQSTSPKPVSCNGTRSAGKKS